MGGSWPRPRRLKNSWEYLYRGDGGEGRGLPWEKLSRKPRRRGLATFTGYRSHPGPIGTVVRADDLVAVRRVALAPIAIHTTFGDHGQLSAGRRHLNFRMNASFGL